MLKKLEREKLKTQNFKVTERERRVFREMADKYTKGNVSEWIRFAALNHKPRKKDLL